MKPNNIIISLFLLFTFVGCKKEEILKDFTLRGTVFGTSYKIKYLNAPKNYQKSIDSLFLLVNTSLSTYIPSSDISRINSGDSTVVVDDLFLEVFKKSKKIYKKTNGYFDPTVGNLVNAYGFGPKQDQKNLTADEVKFQMQFVGYDKVRIVNRKVLKENPAIYLDFNAIAKGFGLDVIARFLDDKMVTNYMIEIGGEIRAKGLKNNKKPWVIQLVNPVEANSENGFRVLDLSNKSMATSGNYRKYRITKSGIKYVHTVNPKTGFASESNLLSASVIANLDCAEVDAFATAFMAMGLEKTKEVLKNHKNLEVILIYINTKGVLEEFTTFTE